MVISVILGVFSLFYAAIIFFLCKGWKALPINSPQVSAFSTTVSILIAARNEEENIGKTLQDILLQNYPKELIEVIVVDDHSSDGTAEVIRSYESEGVRLIQLRENEALNSYKKLAITQAVKKSCGELLVATDADCRMGVNWLSTIVSAYETSNPKLISAPVVYHKERNLFERLQTLEFLFLIGLGAAGIGNRTPSTCNGANLAYRREVFDELDGFKGIDQVASGDDELFLHKVAERYPDEIMFCKSYEAIVYTKPKESLKSFLNQRKRWASKSLHYKNKTIVGLGVSIWLFNVTLLLNSLLAIFIPQLWIGTFIAVSCKLLSELCFMAPLCGFARRKSLLWLLPVLTCIHVIYMTVIGVIGNSGRYDWKGRSVN